MSYLKIMTLTLELPDSKEAALRAKAQAQGLSAEQYVQQVLERDLGESVHGPVSALFREIWGDLPDEARPPKDGLDQIDHYVYGTPKREQ
jgi:hypothetical protein